MKCVIGNVIGNIGEATTATGLSQATVCQYAATAIAAGNHAGPELSRQCELIRGENIAAGDLILDAMPVDAAMRVFLTDTGNRKIAGDPALGAAAAKITDPDVRRGFAIGVQVSRNSRPLQPAYAAKVRATLSPKNAQGFDLALATPIGGGAAPVKAGNPTSSGESSSTLYIAAGVVGVLAVAAVVYKVTRKR